MKCRNHGIIGNNRFHSKSPDIGHCQKNNKDPSDNEHPEIHSPGADSKLF